MKSIKWTLLVTVALASLAFALTIQQQNVAAFNDRNKDVTNTHHHLRFSEDSFSENYVGTFNSGDSHENFNCNSNSHSPQRELAGGNCIDNSVDKP